MLERILIAGSGGQGVILTGKLLAMVGVDHVEHVTFFPSYGAEVRGGTSSCEVILSSREIASPVSETFDSMLLMNQASADRFLDRQAPDCLVVMNRSLCRLPETGRVVAVEALEWAEALGDARAANLIMLGAYLSRKPCVPPEAVEKAVRRMFEGKGSELAERNVLAFRRGLHVEGRTAPIHADRGG